MKTNQNKNRLQRQRPLANGQNFDRHSAREEKKMRFFKFKSFKSALAFTMSVISVLIITAAVTVAALNMSKSMTFSLSADFATKNRGDEVIITGTAKNMTDFTKGIYGFTVDVIFDNERFDFDNTYNDNSGIMKASAIGADFTALANLSSENTVTVLFFADNLSEDLSFLDKDVAGKTWDIFTLKFAVKTDAEYGNDIPFTPADCKIADKKNDGKSFEIAGNVSHEKTKIAIAAKTVTELTLTAPPAKTTYIYDADTGFNPEGMVLTATYNNSTQAVITGGYTADLSWDYGSGKFITLTHNDGVTVEIPGITYQKGTLTAPVVIDTVSYSPDLVMSGLTLSAGWAWEFPDASLDCTITDANAIYRGGDKGNYSNEKINVSLSGKVAKATSPAIAPPSELFVSVSNNYTYLSEIPLGDYAAHWKWDGTPETIWLPAEGEYLDYILVYMDTTNYNVPNATVRLSVVSLIVPHISTAPTASEVTYNPAQTLADIALTGGFAQVSAGDTAPVAGGFEWTDKSVIPSCDVTSYNVTFTPNDSDTYTAVTLSVNLTVNKANPIVSVLPTAATLTYGEKLKDSALSGGVSDVPGSFAWKNADAVPTVINGGYEAVFTPDDTINYNPVTKTVAVNINKAAPTIIDAPSGSEIAYGAPLNTSTISGGGASIAGSFSWSNGNIIPDVVNSGYAVVFTPDDNDNYATVNSGITALVTVTAKAITVTPESGQSKVFGSPNPEIIFSSSDGISGQTPHFAGALSHVGTDVGSYPIELGTLVLTDNGSFKASNYLLVIHSIPVNFTISKANPVISVFPIAATLTYGDKLKDSTLSGGVSDVVGSFAWKNADTIPTVINGGYEAIFTPEDTVNYHSSTHTLSVNVAPNPNPSYTLPVLDEVQLSDNLTLGDIALPEGWTWTTPSNTSLTQAKEYSFLAKFTPSDANYAAKDNIEISFVTVDLSQFEATVTTGADNEIEVTVTAPAGVIPAEAILKADEISADELGENAKDNLAEALGENSAFVSILNIRFENNNGDSITPNGKITVKIKSDASKIGENHKVVYIDQNGNVTPLDTKILDGFAVVNTQHMGYFALVELSGTGTESTADPTTSSVQKDTETGEKSLKLPVAHLISAFLFVIAFMVKKRKHNEQ